jgi:hypothetical protein
MLFGVHALLAQSPYASTSTSLPGSLQISTVVPKESRGVVQQKLSVTLRYEIARVKAVATRTTPRQETGVKLDDRRRALVDVRAAVSPEFQKQIEIVGGTIVSSVPQYESTIAWVPLLMLERLAANPSVKAIAPAAEPTRQSIPQR